MVAATILLGVLVVLMYGPPVFDDGFYYDDWSISSVMVDDPGAGPVGYYQDCHAIDNGNRPGACAFHAVRYWLFGLHPRRVHAFAALLVFLTALALFAVLRRCRLPTWAAGAGAAAFVIFPGSDSTRLWPTGLNLGWALLLWLTGALLGLKALDQRGWKAAVLYVGSFVCLLATMLTYDGMIPVVAMSAAVYLLARRDRPALVLAAASFALAGAYGVWRMWIANIPDAASLTVHRSHSQVLAREGHLLEGGWTTFKTLFLPGGALGLVLLGAGLVIVLAAVALRPAARREILRWAAIAAGCAVFVAVSLTAYITANDFYVPDPGSLFNRLNVAAALAYCLGFVALLGLMGVALRALLAGRLTVARASVLAVGVVATAGLAVAVHQYDYSRDTQRYYNRAWSAQNAALRNIKLALAKGPSRDAIIVSFGHPLFEPRFIPVFSADWDLRGAIDDLTAHDPPQAMPWWGLTCGDDAVMRGTEQWAKYGGSSPIWFVDATTAAAQRITSRAECERAVQQMTPLPVIDPAGLAA